MSALKMMVIVFPKTFSTETQMAWTTVIHAITGPPVDMVFVFMLTHRSRRWITFHETPQLIRNHKFIAFTRIN